MTKPSYMDKIDTSFLMLMLAVSSLPEESSMSEEGSLAMLPELYEKYEKEGCPDWIAMYGSKIKLDKILNIVFNAVPPKFYEDLSGIFDLNPEKYFDSFVEICEKHEDALGKYGELVFEGLKRKKITVLLSAYVVHQIFVCPALFGVSFSELLEKAKKGDHDSIFKLIQIDKSLIGSRWALKEIRKAQLSGDFEFFNKLGRSIKKDAWDKNKKKKENMAQRLVLVFCWNLGLNELTHAEIHDFLTDLGICNYEDTDSLSHEIKKLNLKKSEPKKKAIKKTSGKKMISKTKKTIKKKAAKKARKKKNT